jgi:deferrochelatase/peroxidase EfeB
LGFHEGISNIKPSERSAAVSVNHFNISRLVDQWTINGTYLAFLRISINLEEWENLSQDEQSIIIGRDKLTGCPIIGVNGSGKPVRDGKCPVPGTYEIIDLGNEPFREHPPFGRQINLPEGLTDGPLARSHIGRTRHVDNVPSSLNQSSRIFRQGSEFIETTHEYPFFRVGINFVSFQNSIEKLFRIFTTPSWLGRSNFGQSIASKIADMNTFQSVLASGLFFVPPFNNDEPFPGSSIFR